MCSLPPGISFTVDKAEIVEHKKDSCRGPAPIDRLASDSPHPTDREFDSWLAARLRALYEPVLQEPLPHELIKLIEADRKIKSGT
jgi:hypothetical protein